MSEIRGHETIDAQPSTVTTEGDDISDQHVALLSNLPDSTTSPTTSCTGLSNQSQDNAFTDDGYVSDGMITSFNYRQVNESLSCSQREEVP